MASTASAQSCMFTALHSLCLLNILFNMPSSPSCRAHCIHTRLCRLAKKPYKISGSKQSALFLNSRRVHFITICKFLLIILVYVIKCFNSSCSTGGFARRKQREIIGEVQFRSSYGVREPAPAFIAAAGRRIPFRGVRYKSFNWQPPKTPNSALRSRRTLGKRSFTFVLGRNELRSYMLSSQSQALSLGFSEATDS